MIEQRIKELLLARQLSPTQFADTIGISRPIVSHILSGRNKPSLEVVQRTITAFPELSLPWLLNGVGPMVAAAAQGAEEPPRSRPVRPRNEGTHQPKQTEASEALKPEEAQRRRHLLLPQFHRPLKTQRQSGLRQPQQHQAT